MKRLLSFLVVFCLLLSCCAVAFAAAKPTFTTQPVTQTVKEGGSVNFKVKAKNYTALTWYFVDPENGQKISARHISEKFSGLKVKNPNSQSLTLKKIPEAMHGWSLYCHIVGNGYKVDSDTVMILIKGKEPPANAPAAAEAEAAPDDGEETVPAPSGNAEEAEDAGEAEGDAEGEESSQEAIKPFTVTVSGELELYELSRSGKPSGEPQTSLSFDDAASFYVKANGYIQYLLINDMQLTPADNVTGLTIRGIVKDTAIQGRVLKGSEEDAPAAADAAGSEGETVPEEPSETEADPDSSEAADGEPAGEEEAPVVPVSAEPTPAPEAPADMSSMVTVTCERCRFSGGGNSFATSGYVPVGTVITVVCGSEGNLATGYSINGAAGSNKGQASFKLTVTENTTISMQKRP